MADTRKPSKVLADTLGISGNDYSLMQFNARRYERTDAGVEDHILKQIFDRPEAKEFLENENADPDKKEFVYKSMPGEFGKTKVFNAANVLRAIGAEVPKKDDRESAEEKLVRLYDENPNFVKNRVKMDKDFGDFAADNLPMLVESAREYKATKPELSWPNKIAGSIFYPRSLESMREGRDVQAEDIAGDIAENVLMALPIGWAAGGLKAGRAAKVLAGLGGAFAVPLATEGLDAAMYSPDENLDRSVFQPTDVAFGGATNIAAPFMGSRALGRLGRWTYGGNPLAKQVAKEGSPEAKMIVNDWLHEGKFKMPTKAEQDAARYKFIEADAQKKAFDPEYAILSANARKYGDGEVNEATQKAFAEFNKLSDDAEKMTNRARLAAGFMKQGKSFEDALLMAQSLGDDVATELFNRIDKGGLGKQLAGASLGSWVTNKYGNNRNASATLGILSGLVQNVEPDIDLSRKLEDWRDARAQAAADAYRAGESKKVLDVLEGGEDADTYWLKRLSEEPWIARGEGDGATSSFKNWWNTRGMKLFGDTALFGGIKE